MTAAVTAPGAQPRTAGASEARRPGLRRASRAGRSRSRSRLRGAALRGGNPGADGRACVTRQGGVEQRHVLDVRLM
jgi:hypothetical protein